MEIINDCEFENTFQNRMLVRAEARAEMERGARRDDCLEFVHKFVVVVSVHGCGNIRLLNLKHLLGLEDKTQRQINILSVSV